MSPLCGSQCVGTVGAGQLRVDVVQRRQVSGDGSSVAAELVVVAIGIIAIVLTGLGFAFAEGGSAMRKGIGIVFGLAIAFTATTFISTFFNMTAGAVF